MRRISATTRIGFGLTCATASVLLTAFGLGLFPDTYAAEFEGRKAMCETVAIECSLAWQRHDREMMRALLQSVHARSLTLRSVGLRNEDGTLLVNVGDHELLWKKKTDDAAASVYLNVPIYNRAQVCGNVEFCFEPLEQSTLAAWLITPLVRVIVFIVGASFLLHTLYLRRTLRYLNPSEVVPDRVRAALDALAEGVLLLDKSQRIVLANAAFGRHIGRSADELQGMNPRQIHFLAADGNDTSDQAPWEKTINEGKPQSGVMLTLGSPSNERRTFVVNTTPIIGQDGTQRGAMATFDDVTVVEKKNLQLEEALQALNVSRDEVRQQNQELTILATRDPLTGCLNRRSFFADFEKFWFEAKKAGDGLGCIMVDIDHFKSVNDNHGHATGDQVLQAVGAILRETADSRDLVCRYGGEEFCVVLPHANAAQTMARAEAIRLKIAEAPIAGLQMTASLGLSTSEFDAPEAREMLNQADKSLYFSKRNGRNRVSRFDELPPDFEIRKEARPAAPAPQSPEISIPFPAVSALISALAYRDVGTAQHSRRVADLCLATVRSWLSPRECYVIEVAALLHDIGKVGVPDTILLKPGPLTPQEWEIMRAHDRMGMDILTTAFEEPSLCAIVRSHHARYDGTHDDPELPQGEEIPLGGRLLTIADAYDAMTTDRVYRKGRSRDEAFAELRRCAGAQFDPQLVERFIAATSHMDQSPQNFSKLMGGSRPSQAVLLGGQVEHLARALDSRDLVQMAAMARRVAATASYDRLSTVVDVATQLQRCAEQQGDLAEMVNLTRELLGLCSSAQSQCLEERRTKVSN